MNIQDLRSSYQDFVKGLQRRNPTKGMEIAVGGEFEAIGILERELLIQQGLQPTGYLIDVGCGSGRLAKPLAEFLHVEAAPATRLQAIRVVRTYFA